MTTKETGKETLKNILDRILDNSVKRAGGVPGVVAMVTDREIFMRELQVFVIPVPSCYDY